METESHHRVFCWRRVADAGNARVQGVSRRADIRGRAQNCGGREGGEFGAGRKIFGGGRKILAAVAVVAVGVAAGWQGGDELAGDNSPLRNPANLLVSPAFAQATPEACPEIGGRNIVQTRTTNGVCIPDDTDQANTDNGAISSGLVIPGALAAANQCEAAGWTVVAVAVGNSPGGGSNLNDDTVGFYCDFDGRTITRHHRGPQGVLTATNCNIGDRPLSNPPANLPSSAADLPNCAFIFGSTGNASNPAVGNDTIVFPLKTEVRAAPGPIVTHCQTTAQAGRGLTLAPNADWSACVGDFATAASECTGATPVFSPRPRGVGICVAGASTTPDCDAGIGQILENSVCVVNDTTCSDLDGNAAANSDNTVCVCTHGGTFTGSAGGCNAPPPVSGLLPAGVPATGSISDFEATCLLFGGTINAPNPFVTQCLLPGGAQFEGEDFSIEDARDCALDRRPVTGVGSSAACGAQCADGEVVRGNVCVSGTYNQCDQVPSVCAEGQTCSDSTTGTFEGTSEICTTPPSTCTPGPGEYDDSGTCRCDTNFEVDTVNGGCVACTDGKTSERDTSSATPCACPTGTTATTGSGKCVADAALAAANNCESAGWSLNDARTHCVIRSRDFANHGHSPDDCVLSGGQLDATADGPNSVIGCENIFAGRDENGAVTFPARSDTLDATTPRRFFAYCNGDDDPNGGNNAGQTQCCTPPTTDSDMNPDTVCQVTCDDPGETLNEAGDGCTYTDASCLADYSHSEANSDNTGCVCSVSGGTLGSCAEPAGVSCGTNEVDRNGVCVCEHGGAIPHCHGAAISDADMLAAALRQSCTDGGWSIQNSSPGFAAFNLEKCVFRNKADFQLRGNNNSPDLRDCVISRGGSAALTSFDYFCSDLFPDGAIPADDTSRTDEVRYFGSCGDNEVQTNTDPGCACASGNTLVVADNPTTSGVNRACFGDDSVPVLCEAAGWDYNIPTGGDGYCSFRSAGLRNFQSGSQATGGDARCVESGSGIVCSDLYLGGTFPRRAGAQGAGQVLNYNCPTNSQLVAGGGGGTTCQCDDGYVPGSGNQCVEKTERSVVVEAADLGELSASWTGAANPVTEGNTGTAPVTEGVTYTANPDAGHYVSEWFGACAGMDTGALNAPDTTKTCAVAAGLTDISARATFSPIEPCAGRKRVQTNATTCGACLDNHKTADPAEAGTGTAQCLPVQTCDGTGEESYNNDTACRCVSATHADPDGGDLNCLPLQTCDTANNEVSVNNGTACDCASGYADSDTTTAGLQCAALIPGGDCQNGGTLSENGTNCSCDADTIGFSQDALTKLCTVADADCPVADSEVNPDNRDECRCTSGHNDPNPGDGTLQCLDIVTCTGADQEAINNDTACACTSGHNDPNPDDGTLECLDVVTCGGTGQESYNNDTACRCIAASHADPDGGDLNCLPLLDCGTNEVSIGNGTACECAANHNDSDLNDGDTLTCLPVLTCGTNEESINNGTACQCEANHNDSNLSDGDALTCLPAVTCGTNEVGINNGTACECAANHNDADLNDGDALTCLPVLTCGTNEESINNGTACQCAANHNDSNLSDGDTLTCLPVLTCGTNEESINNGTACECAANHNDSDLSDGDTLTCLPVATCDGANQEAINNGTACACTSGHYDANPAPDVLDCQVVVDCVAPQTDHDNNPRTPCRTTDESCRAVDENSVPTSDIQSCECPHLGTYTGSAGGCTSPAASLRQACEAAGWSFFPANNNCSFSINPHFARMQDHETSRRVGLCYLNAGSNQVACEDIAGPRFEFLTVDQVNAASRTYNGFNHYGVYNCPEGAAPNPNDVSECACTAGFEDPNPGDGTLVCEFVDCATIPNAEDGTGENAGTCVCQSGYADSTPDTRALDCDATVTEAQCQNGGVPDSTTGGTTCDCSAARANGFARDPSTGFCTADFDPNACQNGGTVLPSGGCDCRETGYTGDLCDTLNTISNATDAQCAEAGWTTTIPEGGDARAHCDFTGKQFRRTDTALLGGCTTRNRTSADSGRPPCGLMFGENAGDLFYILPTKAEVGDNDIIVSWFYCQNQTPPAIPNADWSACVSAQTSCENGGALRRRGGDTSTGPQVCLCPEGITGERCEVGGTTVPQNRSVGVSASDDGVVSASWTGLATPIAEGGSGDAPTTEAVTYTATPASGYYVSDWTGACATSANPTSRTTGENDAAGAVQTCVVPAGSDNISAGATFEAATDCSADGRSQVNATACGSCTTGYWDGTTCDDTVFAQATFAAKCAAVGGGSDLGYGPLRQNGVEAIHVCVNIGGDADADCIAILSPAFNSNEDVFDNDGNVSFSGTPTCADKFPACAGHEEQVISGNALSGCQTTNGTCQSVDANSVADTQPAGTTCTCPNGGTFTAGQSDGCNAAPTTRAVTIGDSTNGNVVLTVNGAGVSGTGLGTVPADAELVFSAVPANNGYYVSGWTGACASDAANGATGGDLAPGATTTCTVPAGSSAVNVGATFAAVADCATPNRDRVNATTCGGCSGANYYNGSACVADNLFNQSTFGADCVAAGGLDPVPSFGDSRQSIGGEDRKVGHICWNIGGVTGNTCFLVTHPDFDRTQSAVDRDGDETYSSGTALCHEQFTACASHEVQTASGNQLRGCTTTTASCQSVDTNSDTNGSGGCTCTGTGTFDPNSNSGCDAPVVSCPEGTTTNGVCVTSGNLAQANACEAAGWTVSADGTECVLHTDSNAFNGPHFYTPFGDTAVSRCNFNAEDGLVPLCSDAVHSDHGYPTASDGANFNGQRRFYYDCDSRTSNARPAADYSSCECSPGYSGSWSQTDGCVADPATRAVAVSDAQAGGVVSATWPSNSGSDVAEGGSGNAPTDEAITFTADPDATYYVMEWTGACATSANPTSAGTGSADTADATQTCVVPAGTTDIEAGAIFAEATPAGPTPEERLRSECDGGGNWAVYPTGTSGHLYCYFADSSATNLRDVSGRADFEACYLTQEGATADEDGVGNLLCSDVFPGEGATLDLPDSYLTEVQFNCGANAEQNSAYQCECTGDNIGTPPNCQPAPTTRRVVIDGATDGRVVLTVNNAEVSGSGLNAVAGDAELVFSAIPADTDHYVLSWTGSCGTPGIVGRNLAPGAETTCTIPAGLDSVNVGAVFSDIEPCDSRNRVQTNATSCGICLGGFETANSADANDGSVACSEVVLTCTVLNSEASGGVCVCSSGYADPDNANPTTQNPINECLAVVAATDADCQNGGTSIMNGTDCNCSTGTHDQDSGTKLCTTERSTTTTPTEDGLEQACRDGNWEYVEQDGIGAAKYRECIFGETSAGAGNGATLVKVGATGGDTTCLINDGGFNLIGTTGFPDCAVVFPDGVIPARTSSPQTFVYGSCGENEELSGTACVCVSGYTEVNYTDISGAVTACFADDSDAVACENAGWEYEDFGAGNGPQCNLSPASVRNYSAGATGNARCYYGTPASASDIVCSALFHNGALPGIVGDGTGQVLSHNCSQNSTLTRDGTTGSTTCECNQGFAEEERICVVPANCDIRNRIAGDTPVTCGRCKSEFDNPAGGLLQVEDSSVNTLGDIPVREICVAGTRVVQIGGVIFHNANGKLLSDDSIVGGTLTIAVDGEAKVHNDSVPVTAAVVFTATPTDDTWYVYAWSNSCVVNETGDNTDTNFDAPTGQDDAVGGLAKVCTVPAGSNAATGGVTFRQVIECGDGRTAGTNTNSACGPCDANAGYAEQGGSCVLVQCENGCTRTGTTCGYAGEDLGFTGATCGVCAADKYRTNRDGTVRCEAPDSGDTATGALICSTATDKGTGSALGLVLNSAGDDCVSQCPAGQEAVSNQCQVCGAGTYNPTAGGTCQTCAGITGGGSGGSDGGTGSTSCEMCLNGGTRDGANNACACPNTHEGATCGTVKTRSVSVSDAQANGEVSANWTSAANPIGEGESDAAPVTEDVTFTATPAAGYYVSDWTGGCAADADPVPASRDTGASDASAGMAKTCVVSAGLTDIAAAGAVFSVFADCPTLNRAREDAGTCGVCDSGHNDLHAPGDTTSACREDVVCSDAFKEQTNAATCGECLEAYNDVETSGTCVLDTDCGPLFRTQVNDATCGACISDYNDLHDPGTTSTCRPDVNCAPLFRAQADAATCGTCVGGYNDLHNPGVTTGACRVNVNCAPLNRVQSTDAVCGGCNSGFNDLNDPGNTEAACQADVVCSTLNREQTNAATCGDCSEGFNNIGGEVGAACVANVVCADRNRLQTNDATCGACVADHNDLHDEGNTETGSCNADLVCADEFRVQTNAATCGDCLSTHALRASDNTCQERVNCDGANKIQTNPYTCGDCKSGFNDLGTSGVCVADVECAPLNRIQTDEANCGDCNNGFNDIGLQTGAACVANVVCSDRNRLQTNDATCGACVADHNDLHDPNNTATGNCVANVVCVDRNRLQTDGANCGACVDNYSEVDGECKPHLVCADLFRETTANLAVCGDCLSTHTEVGEVCVENANCAEQNREQTGATCGGCLAEHTEINNQCLPNKECGPLNRAQTNAAQCGACNSDFNDIGLQPGAACVANVECAPLNRVRTNDAECGACNNGFNDIGLQTGAACVANVVCADRNRMQTNDATCGACVADYNDLHDEGNTETGSCNANLVCADEFRVQTNAATCGDCLSTHALRASDNTCQERVNCAPLNRVQDEPYECGACIADFNNIGGQPGDACVANVVCADRNRVQTDAANCGACLPEHTEIGGSCLPNVDCSTLNRAQTNAAQCGVCDSGHNDLHDQGNTEVACREDVDCGADQNRVQTDAATCGACLPEHTEIGGSCLPNVDCSTLNRAQTNAAQCGVCDTGHNDLHDQGNTEAACRADLVCSDLNRAQTNAATCGDCNSGFNNINGQSGDACAANVVCADRNRLQMNDATCGACVADYNDLHDEGNTETGNCVANENCAAVFRVQTNAATCGDCLSTHALRASDNTCQERVNCDGANKIQTNPYTCGDCKSGFNDLGTSGVCVADVECAPLNRIQTDEANCGDCNNGFNDIGLQTGAACVANVVCADRNRMQTNDATCGACVADHNDLHDPNNTATGNCVANVVCADRNRLQTDGANCGACVDNYSEVGGECKPHLVCADLFRETTSNAAVCGDCLSTHTEVGEVCVENANCAGQNREQTGATCGGCLAEHTEINNQCLPNKECGPLNRAQTNAAQCGACDSGFNDIGLQPGAACVANVVCADRNRVQTNDANCGACNNGFNDIGLQTGAACVANVVCADRNRMQTNDATCGACVADYNDLHDEGNTETGSCNADLVCSDQNRVQTNAATCGDCLATHAPDDSNVCQERVNCAPLNRVQDEPYECGACNTGFNNIGGQSGAACVANVVCADRNRLQTNDATCGACVADHNDLHDEGNLAATCQPNVVCADQNRVQTDAANCGACLPQHTEINGQCMPDMNCAPLNRVQTNAAQCGACVADHTEVGGDCMPNLECGDLFRAATTNPAVCGNCLSTHTEVNEVCVENADCAGQNRIQDGSTCGACVAEHTEVGDECKPNLVCSDFNRLSTENAAVCGDCVQGYKDNDGTCELARAVVINQPDAADGMITLMVNGAGVAAEDLGAVVSDATLVFGAVPADNDHYVLSWSGDCATPGATGETLAGGTTTECRIEPGTTEVTVGATFGDVRVCANENRVNTNATECGGCVADHTETSGNANSSGTCVADGVALAAANACEAAGWNVNPFGSWCLINIYINNGFTPQDFCTLVTDCGTAFGDGSGGYNFPTKTGDDDARRFVYGCQGNRDNPSGANTIGETQCCSSPSVDMDGTCEVPASHCTGVDANSIPNSNFNDGVPAGDSNPACVCSDGSDIPSGESCPEAAAIDYCPAGQELNEAGTVCTDCGATEYNPTPGGECMVCGANGTRTATSCDCDAGYAIGASGECVLASPRAEMVSVAVSELTATPEENYFVEEWIGMDCADANAATGDADDTGSAGAKTCTLATPTDATATVGVVYSYSRGATLATVPSDGTGGTLYATVAAAVPEELETGDRVSSREYAFIVAVPADGYRVTSWGEAEGVCANAPVSPDDNDTGAKVCVIRPGDDDVNVTVTFTAVTPPSGGGGGL